MDVHIVAIGLPGNEPPQGNEFLTEHQKQDREQGHKEAWRTDSVNP